MFFPSSNEGERYRRRGSFAVGFRGGTSRQRPLITSSQGFRGGLSGAPGGFRPVITPSQGLPLIGGLVYSLSAG
jgi:hypothetical protein